MAAETPTIVLVHGAWADATGFDAEIRALQGRGHTAIGFGNPLRDLDGDAAYLAAFLRTLSGPIVLVGHSYGGNVISAAAVGNDQVRALVYFSGWMCDVGESQQQLLEKFEGSLVGPSIRPVPFTNPDGSEGTDLYLAPEAFRAAFAADVDPEKAAVMAATQRPYAAAAFAATPSTPPAWNTLPCWYLLGTDDKAIPPELQRFMAERANATIVEVPALHVSPPVERRRTIARLRVATTCVTVVSGVGQGRPPCPRGSAAASVEGSAGTHRPHTPKASHAGTGAGRLRPVRRAPTRRGRPTRARNRASPGEGRRGFGQRPGLAQHAGRTQDRPAHGPQHLRPYRTTRAHPRP